jgi:hypothetical protein
MRKKSLFSLLRKAAVGRRPPAGRRREFKPVGEPLEGRALLAAAVAVSALQQLGIPSVFSIGSTGNVNYDFLTIKDGEPAWNGWTLVPGGVGVTAISAGTVLTSAIPRPFVFAINDVGDLYYNAINSSGNFKGWTPVGLSVGAVSISTGTLPITNTPYVVMINTNDDVWFNSQLSNGTWAGWTPVGQGVGAVSVATGIVQASLSPTVYEPYVFMMNTSRDVYYKVRELNGSWSNWSPVGVGVGAASISATTISNKPNVSLLNTDGNIYINAQAPSGAWLGWSPVGGGSGSGATPAVASLAIISSYNNYEFALNPSGQLFSSFGTYGRFSTWFGVGVGATGVNAVAFTATSTGSSGPFAFAIGNDGIVYWADQTSWASWSTFASLGAPS